MSERREKTKLDVYVIPENFVDTGRCFNGMFRTRNIIEGIVVAFPVGRLLLLFEMSITNKIALIGSVVGSILILFAIGINGDSVTEFLYHFAVYQKRKRVAKYNPRVKLEATPGYLTKEMGTLPRDRILSFFQSITGHKNAPTEEDAISRDIYDPIYIEFFQDDLGVEQKPNDIKSKWELFQESRQRKKEQKEERANQRAAEKERKAAERTMNKERAAAQRKANRRGKGVRKKDKGRTK